MNTIYLLLGSNIGDSRKVIQNAINLIEVNIGSIQIASSLYQSEAWGIEDQPVFLNQVLKIETILDPISVLNHTQDIENQLGRVRKLKWGARIIDIDILYYNDQVFHSEHLQIPHPFIHERNFTLTPLTEIAPEYIHPILKKTNSELLLSCTDNLQVQLKND